LILILVDSSDVLAVFVLTVDVAVLDAAAELPVATELAVEVLVFEPCGSSFDPSEHAVTSSDTIASATHNATARTLRLPLANVPCLVGEDRLITGLLQHVEAYSQIHRFREPHEIKS
jgi:hypothetical protein